MWGLKPDEAFFGCLATTEAERQAFVVQATLRHVYKEGEKPCPHLNDDEYGPQVLEKWKCFTCRAELAKEAGL